MGSSLGPSECPGRTQTLSLWRNAGGRTTARGLQDLRLREAGAGLRKKVGKSRDAPLLVQRHSSKPGYHQEEAAVLSLSMATESALLRF